MSERDDIRRRELAERELDDYRGRLEQLVRDRTEQNIRIERLLQKARETEQALRDSEAGYRALAEQRQLLLAELSHRVKNTLATVQGIMSQTRRHCTTPEEFERAVEGRIHLLAKAHTVLLGSEWQGAMMAEVMRSVLAPYSQFNNGGIRMSGPDCWLPARHVLSLSMLLYELATNSLKHGAWSAAGGVTEIRWRMEGPRLNLHWRESGGPAVVPPSRTGFGTELITRVVAHELGGRTNLSFEPAGVECAVEFDLPEVPAAELAAR